MILFQKYNWFPLNQTKLKSKCFKLSNRIYLNSFQMIVWHLHKKLLWTKRNIYKVFSKLKLSWDQKPTQSKKNNQNFKITKNWSYQYARIFQEVQEIKVLNSFIHLKCDSNLSNPFIQLQSKKFLNKSDSSQNKNEEMGLHFWIKIPVIKI